MCLKQNYKNNKNHWIKIHKSKRKNGLRLPRAFLSLLICSFVEVYMAWFATEIISFILGVNCIPLEPIRDSYKTFVRISTY